MRRRFFILLAFFTTCALPLHAQESVRAYIATLPQMTQRDVATAAASGSNRLARAFAALELHVRSGNEPDAARALRNFAELVRDEPNNPWAHYGFGLSLATVKSKTAPYRVLNLDNNTTLSVMEQELKRALRLDPSLHEAAELLDSMEAKLATSDVPQHLRESSTADELGRAVTLFRAGNDVEGGKLYFESLAHADSTALVTFIEDLRLLASDEELIFVTDGDTQKRVEAVRTFWKKRAVRDGVTQAERIGEHYRRLQVALARYRPPFNTVETSRRADGRKRIGLERVLDDRGFIYVRYGEPPARTGESSAAARAQTAGAEVWAYRDAAGRSRMFFFLNGRFETDPNKLLGISPQIDQFIMANDMRVAFIGAHSETVRLWNFMLRGIPESDTYMRTLIARHAGGLATDNERMAQRIRERNFNLLFEALEMDAAPHRYPKALLAFADFATFRGSKPGCTDLVYSVLAPVPSYRLSVAVADTFTWETQSIDTTVVARDWIGGQNLRSSGVFCTLPDPNAFVTVAVAADSAGATTGGDVNVKDYSGSDLMMSDMLFAQTQPGGFVRGNARLSLVPPRQFKEGDPIRVFYELYNLPRGHRYKTEITLTTVEPNVLLRVFKGSSKTTVTFDDVANTDGVVQELRTVVPQVHPGEVQLAVKVTDLQNGQSTSSGKKVWIIPVEKPE